MIRLTKRVPCGTDEQTTLTLPAADRMKSRLRATLDDGRAAGLFLARGTALRNGDLLASDDGLVVRIVAAREKVSSVVCENPLLMARACYHLGNRHVPLQIDTHRICYLHDRVLDDMLASLGLKAELESTPFEAEPGAYHHGHVPQSP